MAEAVLQYRGFLKGHEKIPGEITTLQTGTTKDAQGNETEFLISGGRDNKLITWTLVEKKPEDQDKEWGYINKTLSGHSHFVNDVTLSQDSKYAISASWDKTLRLWNLQRGVTDVTFVDHSKDVLTCSFSADNKQIASGGRDNKIKIWNVKGECKYTVEEDDHHDWVSCVRFSPDTKKPLLASASWDGTVKIWDPSSMSLINTFVGHSNAVLCLAFATGSKYLASGGKDGNILLWNLETNSFIKSKSLNYPINQIAFSSVNYQLAAATDNGIHIWDLVKDQIIASVEVHVGENDEQTAQQADDQAIKEVRQVPATSLAWNKACTLLYTGWGDNKIRVYEVAKQ